MSLITSPSAVYSANGNILGVLLLNQELFAGDDCRNSSHLRRYLVRWSEVNNVDSIMVLSVYTGSDKKQKLSFTMDVFEPRGIDDTNMPGSWSSMCGNGLMAASLFFEDHFRRLDKGERIYFQTDSGLRIATKVAHGTYSVCMGEFTYRANDLERYVHLDEPRGRTELFQMPVPDQVFLHFCNTWSIGFSGDRGVTTDGEPHAVLLGQPGQVTSVRDLTVMATQEGPLVTKNRAIFPQEINASFAIVQNFDVATKQINVLGCTHERGLGDARRSVTGACGTGATAIAATLYRLHNLDDGYLVRIRMPGGFLRVYRGCGQFYLIGKAKKYQG